MVQANDYAIRLVGEMTEACKQICEKYGLDFEATKPLIELDHATRRVEVGPSFEITYRSMRESETLNAPD